MGNLKCLTLIQITGKPLQKKKVSAYILFLNPKERQYVVMGFVIQEGTKTAYSKRSLISWTMSLK